MMRKLRVVVAGLALSASAQAGGGMQVITPVFHQLVLFTMPAGFSVGGPEQLHGNDYLRETPLRGQTVERWTQMITLSGSKGRPQNSGLSPERLTQNFAASFERACPESFAVKALGPAPVKGGSAYAAVIGCGNVPDEHGAPGARHSETALIVGIRGDQDIYTVQWAERGPTATRAAVDDPRWPARLKTLAPIKLCAEVPGEPPPYPSCRK